MCPSDPAASLTAIPSRQGVQLQVRPPSEATFHPRSLPTLPDRLVELRCPLFLRDAINNGAPHCTWDIPYRGRLGAPKYAWVIYYAFNHDRDSAVSLTVEALEFGLGFSQDGALVRARMGNRYLSLPESSQFYETLLVTTFNERAPLL